MWILRASDGRRVALPVLPAVIGSDAGADVVLRHPSLAARHVRASEHGDGALTLVALGGGLLETGGWEVGEARLAPGQQVRLGALSFTLEREDEDPVAAAAEGAARSRYASAERVAEDVAPPTDASPPRAAARGPGRPPPADPREALLARRASRVLVSRRDAGPGRGLLDVDLSQLTLGARLAVLAALLALAAGAAWLIQALVVAAG